MLDQRRSTSSVKEVGRSTESSNIVQRGKAVPARARLDAYTKSSNIVQRGEPDCAKGRSSRVNCSAFLAFSGIVYSIASCGSLTSIRFMKERRKAFCSTMNPLLRRAFRSLTWAFAFDSSVKCARGGDRGRNNCGTAVVSSERRARQRQEEGNAVFAAALIFCAAVEAPVRKPSFGTAPTLLASTFALRRIPRLLA